MIPHTQQALGFVIQRLLTSIGPELTTSYAMADLGLIATLLSMFGQDFTRAADARQTDIQEMADIFSDAQGLIRDEEFRKKLAATQGLHLTNFDIDNLDAIHAEHSALLIETHARIEQIDSRAAEMVNREIWAHLEKHAERHRYEADF